MRLLSSISILLLSIALRSLWIFESFLIGLVLYSPDPVNLFFTYFLIFDLFPFFLLLNETGFNCGLVCTVLLSDSSLRRMPLALNRAYFAAFSLMSPFRILLAALM